MARNLVVVSGYYGFDNLGDEAICEELITELSSFVKKEEIVVLSNQPEATARRYGVTAADRWQLSAVAPLMLKAKLFISGGGGLFQDTESVNSVIYYGGLICLARTMGARVMVYAQGIGPLRQSLSQLFTKSVFNMAQAITVRDGKSLALLNEWGLAAIQTEDPVWLLPPAALPEDLTAELGRLRADRKAKKAMLVGLSLRKGGGFDQPHIEALAKAMIDALPKGSTVVGLALQKEQDEPALDIFARRFGELGGLYKKLEATQIEAIERPSQWVNLLGNLDMVIGMRLHSLIMALGRGVPVVGIAYDPKVTRVLEEFGQANLDYERNSEEISAEELNAWTAVVKESIKNNSVYAAKADKKASECREKACQNVDVIAKILQ
jgi:polysaccharide pyruvyl transferase CsaB